MMMMMMMMCQGCVNRIRVLKVTRLWRAFVLLIERTFMHMNGHIISLLVTTPFWASELWHQNLQTLEGVVHPCKLSHTYSATLATQQIVWFKIPAWEFGRTEITETKIWVTAFRHTLSRGFHCSTSESIWVWRNIWCPDPSLWGELMAATCMDDTYLPTEQRLESGQMTWAKALKSAVCHLHAAVRLNVWK